MTDPKLRRRAVAVVGVAALALHGTAQAQDGPATPAELVRQFQAAMAARNIDRIAGFYAEQGVILTPQGGAVAGRDQIRASLARNLAAGQPSLRLVSARFDGGADVGVVIWVWETEAAPAERRRVRSMLYVKKASAGWQIVADMFQVFAPAPG